MKRIELSADLIQKIEDFNSKLFDENKCIVEKKLSKRIGRFKKRVYKLRGKNGFALPKVGLRKVYDGITDNNQKLYLKKIFKEYDSLLSLKPSQFLAKKREFDFIYMMDGVKDSDSTNFAKKIVKALRYQTYRETQYPKIIDELGWNLKTCFYCNYAGTLTVLNDDSKYATFYDLDHVMPKSIYPFLATSFFNFIPSCATCNRNKSNKIIPNLNPFFEPGEPNTSLKRIFRISNKSKVEFYVSNNKDKIGIEVENTVNNIKLEDYIHISNLNLLYNTQKHEVEEILWKKKIYSQTYITAMKKIFSRFYLDKNQVNRILWGTDLDDDTINDKPLAKFKFDLINDK